MKDSLKQYVSLRQSLLAEKSKLETRLAAINAALNAEAKSVATAATVAPGSKTGKKRKMSAAGREAIRAAQKARWAKVHAGKKG